MIVTLGADGFASLAGCLWSSCTATRTTTTRSCCENLDALLLFVSSWLTWPWRCWCRWTPPCGPTQSTWRLKEPDVVQRWTNGTHFQKLFNSNQKWATAPVNYEVMPSILPVRRFMGLYCLNRTKTVSCTRTEWVFGHEVSKNNTTLFLFLIVLELLVGINDFLLFSLLLSHSWSTKTSSTSTSVAADWTGCWALFDRLRSLGCLWQIQGLGKWLLMFALLIFSRSFLTLKFKSELLRTSRSNSQVCAQDYQALQVLASSGLFAFRSGSSSKGLFAFWSYLNLGGERETHLRVLL